MVSMMLSRNRWKSLIVRILLALFLLAALTPAMPAAADPPDGREKPPTRSVVPAPVEPKRPPVKPQGDVRNLATVRPVEQVPGAHFRDPVDLKVLVVSADGSDSDFQAAKASLDRIGIPYDTMIAKTTPLVQSKLWDGTRHGYYQGIILTSGNLGYYDSESNSWLSAFTNDEWAILWQYEAMFGIRQVTTNTYPAGAPDNYGLALESAGSGPFQARLTTEGKKAFSYLNPNNPVVINAWTYLATVISPTLTTPLLVTSDGRHAIASIHRYPDGRQNLAVTTANNSEVMHSLLMYYGIVNWVTKGLFVGERHVNLDAQVDDIMIGNDIWDTVALTDTTGLTYRMTGDDLRKVVNWQNSARISSPSARRLSLDMAFNGQGSSGMYTPDTLTPVIKQLQGQFNWVNHTFSHANLDAITRTLALGELSNNDRVARQLRLSRYFKDSMVQPDVSGLNNPEFLGAAKDFGIRYMVSDASKPAWNNPSPNAGFYSTFQPSILIIPRRATNLYYNVSTPDQWVSEYNCFYGPAGTCNGGLSRYWDHNLSYQEILDKESEMMLSYLLKGDLDPLMFHQANLRAFDGAKSLLGDLVNATLAKYNRLFNLPIVNQTEHEVGLDMARRMAVNVSGLRATATPCTSITLTASKDAVVPVTGVAYGSNREVYGGQNISYVQVRANQPVTIRLPACR